MAESGHLLVAAFDFGTTFSGYAFSFRNKPLQIQTNQGWNAGTEKLISLKTPTCVLLNRNGEFDSFGFEAENKYSSLAEDNKHHGWMFFEKFKMILHNSEGLSRTATVEDINGRKMPAMTIFSMSIGYLKDHLMEALTKQSTGIEETDIQYVITVPAIWQDNAKQFMREAAVKAGMDQSRLKLALEPEAASIWCQTVTTDARAALATSKTKYMVIDLGGGTADITVHEKNQDGTLTELHKSSGGPWGGMYVDKNYFKWLEDLYGRTSLEKLKEKDMADYFDLLREFETKKRAITSTSSQSVVLRISAALNEVSEKENHNSLNDRLAALSLKKLVEVKRDRMRVDPNIVRGWFDGPVNSVIKHVADILAEERMKSVSVVLLVGGFGESPYVQEKMRRVIGGMRKLVVPNEAGLAVLKGAVRFGHVPGVVSSRVMKYTYGVACSVAFNETLYPGASIKIHNGLEMVDNVFYSFVSSGQSVRNGHEATKGFTPLSFNSSLVEVFRSTDVCPKYITDSACEFLGSIPVEHKEGNTLEDKRFDVIMIFGEAELFVKVRMRESGREFYTTIDCLK